MGQCFDGTVIHGCPEGVVSEIKGGLKSTGKASGTLASTFGRSDVASSVVYQFNSTEVELIRTRGLGIEDLSKNEK